MNSARLLITMQTMKDPVMAADGHTYERVAIEEWLKKNSISPQTGLTKQHLVDKVFSCVDEGLAARWVDSVE